MSRERLAATLDMSMTTIVRWENRPDPQMLFRSQVQDFTNLYKSMLGKKPAVHLFTTKEEAVGTLKPAKKNPPKRKRLAKPSK